MKRIFQSILSVLLVAGLLALYIPQASSVVQNLTVIDSVGEPVRSQTVSITFPDGKTTAEEKTDDDGLLIFDFPDDGDYLISFPGGQMTYVVEGGIPMYIKVGGVLIAITGAFLLIDDDDNDSSGTASSASSASSSGIASSASSSGITSSASSSGITSSASSSGISSSASSSGGVIDDPDGEYELDEVDVTSNVSDHPVEGIVDAIIGVSELCTEAVIENAMASTSATLTGTCDPHGPFSWSGTGTYAGIGGTDFMLMGTFHADTGMFMGSGVIGGSGNLPGMGSLDFDFTASMTGP